MSTAEKERVVFMRGRDRDFTVEEYWELSARLHDAEDREDWEEFDQLSKSFPISPTAVKAFKEVYGKDFILECGFDLTEADIAFGKGWLDE